MQLEHVQKAARLTLGLYIRGRSSASFNESERPFCFALGYLHHIAAAATADPKRALVWLLKAQRTLLEAHIGTNPTFKMINSNCGISIGPMP
jgi:hypothetical protein